MLCLEWININWTEDKDEITFVKVSIEDKVLNVDNMKSRKMYDVYLSKYVTTDKAKLKYMMYFNMDITPQVWERYYMLPHLCIINNEIKEMQFKILHRYLATNKLLYDMRKVDSPRCVFCNLHSETICHLFF